VVITGIHSQTQVPFAMSPMRRKELAVFNVRRSNHETREALQMLAEHARWFAPLLTHTRPMDQIAEAFAIAHDYTDGVGKMVVKP
jgi:L-iditol 2-dehydrogenase